MKKKEIEIHGKKNEKSKNQKYRKWHDRIHEKITENFKEETETKKGKDEQRTKDGWEKKNNKKLDNRLKNINTSNRRNLLFPLPK